MKYYKFIDNEGNITFQAHNEPVIREEMIEITEDEYNSVIEELRTKAESEVEAEKVTKDTYIKELENENAALLYQVLTGEELTDAE